jgi:hypothetical protein
MPALEVLGGVLLAWTAASVAVAALWSAIMTGLRDGPRAVRPARARPRVRPAH